MPVATDPRPPACPRCTGTGWLDFLLRGRVVRWRCPRCRRADSGEAAGGDEPGRPPRYPLGLGDA